MEECVDVSLHCPEGSEPPQLVMVTHPGIVRNVDKAFETLGGAAAIAHSCHIASDPTHTPPLQMRFRHGSHPISSKCEVANGILLRVVRRKKTGHVGDGGTGDGGEPTEGKIVSVEAIGLVNARHTFTGMC